MWFKITHTDTLIKIMGFSPSSAATCCVSLSKLTSMAVFSSAEQYLPHRVVRIIILVNVLLSLEQSLTHCIYTINVSCYHNYYNHYCHHPHSLITCCSL